MVPDWITKRRSVEMDSTHLRAGGFVTGRRLDVGQDVGAAAADAGQILANLAKAMI
jgi:hypothetical protein